MLARHEPRDLRLVFCDARRAAQAGPRAAASEPADDLFGPVPFGPDGGVGPYRGRG
jgi:hypothetical protein